jgi:hypothetical protein
VFRHSSTVSSTTFNIPNRQGISATGVGSQNINGRAKAGPALGALREDQVQGHWHNLVNSGGNQLSGISSTPSASGSGASVPLVSAGTYIRVGDPINDSTNGTPRTGAYTHGPEIGMNFIIKT